VALPPAAQQAHAASAVKLATAGAAAVALPQEGSQPLPQAVLRGSLPATPEPPGPLLPALKPSISVSTPVKVITP
jgi:hypothetical protein